MAEPEGSYYVEFPDLLDEGAYSSGESLQQAFRYAREVLEMVLGQMKKDGTPIPVPSKPEDITFENEYNLGGFVSLIEGWTENHDNDERNKSVRVNCTIPRWLKEEADEEGLNFSQILQNGIRRQLHLEQVNK